MTVKTYDAGQFILIFGGVSASGLNDGVFAVASRDEPAFTNGSGSDGEGWRAKSNNRTGTIVVTLLQTSLANDGYSAIAALDEASGDGVSPILLKDGSGRTLIQADTAWIEKYADSEFARDISTREWTFKTDRLNTFVGGN